MQEAELQELITGCLNQDKKDQKKLYQYFYAYSMSICLRYAANRYEAAEVLNQGFFNIFTKIDKYEPDRPFKAWIGRIMTNAAIDYYRSNLKFGRTEELEKAIDVSNDDFSDKKLVYDDLLYMIRQLPASYRTVFMLYAVDGYTHEEIAETLGITSSTSRSNLFKARTKLKLMIQNEEEVPDRKPGLLQLLQQRTDQFNMNELSFSL